LCTLWALCSDKYRWQAITHEPHFRACAALTNAHAQDHPLRAEDGETIETTRDVFSPSGRKREQDASGLTDEKEGADTTSLMVQRCTRYSDEDRGAAVLAGGSMKTTSEETNIPYITLNAIDQIWCSEHGRFIFLLQVGVGSTHNPINRDVSSDGSDWLNPIFDLLR
ncbi:hypothetical protein GN958_ATG06771, partial [Phytophthora infestans]